MSFAVKRNNTASVKSNFSIEGRCRKRLQQLINFKRRIFKHSDLIIHEVLSFDPAKNQSYFQ